MFTWIKNLSIDLDKVEDMFSRKQILRSTASGMHSTADGLRATAEYLDEKASLLEQRADLLEMKEMVVKVSKAMGEERSATLDVLTQEVVRIPRRKMNTMTTQEVIDELGIQVDGVSDTAY